MAGVAVRLDRVLYRLLTGSWGAFAFHPGADVDGPGDAVPPAAGSVARPAPLSAGPTAVADSFVPHEVGLYVHIPFCRSICPFCPYTKVQYEPENEGGFDPECSEAQAIPVLLHLTRIAELVGLAKRLQSLAKRPSGQMSPTSGEMPALCEPSVIRLTDRGFSCITCWNDTTPAATSAVCGRFAANRRFLLGSYFDGFVDLGRSPTNLRFPVILADPATHSLSQP